MAKTKTLQHVAFIMDGNGRWAQARGLPRLEGHRKGAEAVRNMVAAALKNGVPYLTFYAFSTENWSRSTEEVEGLMNLLRFYFKKELAHLAKQGVRIVHLGDKEAHTTQKLPHDIVDVLRTAEEKTKQNNVLTVCFAINYGGRDEILRAAEKWYAYRVAHPEKQGEEAPLLADFLDTAEIPDPDIVVRTSGEQRLSNFLLWQAAYSELLFLPCAWPEMSEEMFQEVLESYQARDRRFGAVKIAQK